MDKHLSASDRSRQGVRPSARRPYTLDRVVRLLIGVAFAVGALLLVDKLRDVLLPFLVAWVIAYVLEPLVQFNKRIFHLRKRFGAVLLSLLQTALVLTALFIILVPSVVSEVQQMGAIIKHYIANHPDIPFIPEGIHEFLRDNIDLEKLSDSLSKQDMETIMTGLGTVLVDGIDIILGIFNWFLVLLYVIFIMLDYDRLISGFRRLVPPKYRRVVFRVCGDVQHNMNHYFRGQGLVSLFVGIIFAAGFAVIGLPLGVVLGLCIGVLNMVPYLQLISIVPCTLLCIVYSVDSGSGFWTIWWECMALYCVCQAIQDLFLTPKIMGRYMGLNPAIILLSLSIWGCLLGFVGLIIALPLTTLLLAYYNNYITRKEKENPGTP
ncbi:MAG: AI-2E family transporter [Bacteroidales bacterium]|nr:AI-2E family transporter [Bacteroidales bacterium]